MSKIDEMAEKAFPNDVGFLYLSRRTGYMRGANDALREIEKVLVAANEQYTSKQAVALNTEIYNKIRELKGE